MTAVTIATNRLSCVVREIVRLAGNVVRDKRTIDAFLNGCFAMEKTTVVTIRTRSQRVVQLAIIVRTLNVRTIDAYLSSGCVTSLTTAAMVAMKLRQFARINIENVLNRNSNARTASALRQDGDVITKTIAEI